MFTTAKSLLLHAITSVHAGSGSEVGLVDLPIQREKQTGFPKVESSSLRGAIREFFERKYESEAQNVIDLFGSKYSQDAQAGAISLSDARILLFPIRSVKGVFTWITCPFVLNRFNQEMSLYHEQSQVLTVPEANTVSSESIIISNNKIVLEEYTHEITVCENTKKLASELAIICRNYVLHDIESRLVVLNDDDFANYVKLSTEVNARIKIDDNGTAENLWYEENVPAETVFYMTIFSGQVRVKNNDGNDERQFFSAEEVELYVIDKFPKAFQLGGNHSLGRGLMKTIWL